MVKSRVTRNALFWVAMCLLFVATAFILTPSALRTDAADDTDMVKITIINVSPDKVSVDASDRTGSNLQGKQPAWSTGGAWKTSYIGGLSATRVESITDDMSIFDFINLKYPTIEAGYIPVAMWVEPQRFQSLSTATRVDFRQWMWNYVLEMSSIMNVDTFTYADSYIMPRDNIQDFDTGAIIGTVFSPLGTGNDIPRAPTGKNNHAPLYLVVGAIPMEEDAISVSVQTVGTMNIGNDYHYQSPWTIEVKITNNASLPLWRILRH